MIGKVPLLAHIHVPKCSGSSLRAALDASFPSGGHRSFYFDHDTDFVYADSELAALVEDPAVCAFSSHFVRRFPAELAGRAVFYITFLRDPVQQFLSYLKYTRRHYQFIHEPALLGHLPPEMPTLTLRECAHWVLTGNPNVFRNFQENYTTNFFARYPVLEEFGFAYQDPRYRALRLGAAKRILAGFPFTGISERMDESWVLLQGLAGQAGLALPAFSIPRENVSERLSEDLSWIHAGDEVGSLLLASLAEDRELYRWANGHFDDELASSGSNERRREPAGAHLSSESA